MERQSTGTRQQRNQGLSFDDRGLGVSLYDDNAEFSSAHMKYMWVSGSFCPATSLISDRLQNWSTANRHYDSQLCHLRLGLDRKCDTPSYHMRDILLTLDCFRPRFSAKAQLRPRHTDTSHRRLSHSISGSFYPFEDT